MRLLKNILKNKKLSIIILLAFISLPIIFYNKKDINIPNKQYKTVYESDVYTRFAMEAYDKIGENFWMKLGSYKKYGSPELGELFRLSIMKVMNTDKSPTINKENKEATDRDNTAFILSTMLRNATSSELKKQIIVDTVRLVTNSLKPFMRSNLFSEKQRVALRQEVSNINPSKDLYKDLGVNKDTSKKEIEKVYEEKAKVLEKATTTEAKTELQKISYAKKVLTDDNTKKLYDTAKVEPTVSGHIMNNTFYFYFSKISPITLQEFGIAIENASSTPNLDSLIIDMRGNIGGDLSFANSITGLFIGANQYAYDLYRNENYDPQRTTLAKFDALNRFKNIVIFTDNRTQSTAELTSAIFKRLKIAKIIGTRTAGWGTIENTYPLETVIDTNEKYTLFLVNNITLGDDNEPIEGRGVSPDIDISKSDWKNELKKYFPDSFIKIIEKRISVAPAII